MIPIHTVIDLYFIVPKGTAYAAFNLLKQLGSLTIHTTNGDMVTLTYNPTV